MIHGQIILVKQVNIHVYSIGVRHLSLMSIVNPLHVRVYWLFQGTASYAESFLLFMFHVGLFIPSCLFLVALWSPAGRDWPLVCGIFLCFCCFPMWCPGSGVVLGCINS